MKLSHGSRCWSAQLSRRPEDLLVLLESIRAPECTAMVRLPASARLSTPPQAGDGAMMRMAM
jgi:hypothetical protein